MADGFNVTQEINRYMSEIEGQLARIVVIAEHVSDVRARLADQAELGQDHVAAIEELAVAAASIRGSMTGVKTSLDGVAGGLGRLSLMLSERTQVVSDVVEGLSTRVSELHNTLDSMLNGAELRIDGMVEESLGTMRAVQEAGRESDKQARRALEEAELAFDRSRRDLAEELAAIPGLLQSTVFGQLSPLVAQMDVARTRLHDLVASEIPGAIDIQLARLEEIGVGLSRFSVQAEAALAAGVGQAAEALEPVREDFSRRIEELSGAARSIDSLLANSAEFTRLAGVLESNARVMRENADIQRAIQSMMESRRAPIGHRVQVALLGAAISYAFARYGLNVAHDKSLMAVIPAAIVSMWAEPVFSLLMQSRSGQPGAGHN